MNAQPLAQAFTQPLPRAANDALACAPLNPVVTLRFCGLDVKSQQVLARSKKS